MFTSIKTPWQLAGVMLFLVLVYLLLTNSKGAVSLLGGATRGWIGILRTLQGRNG
jgi:hypothetical protein